MRKTKMKTKKTELDPKVWLSRMKRFLEAQSFTEEEQVACIQFVEQFVHQVPVYLQAINAIQCYLNTTMILADKEMREEQRARPSREQRVRQERVMPERGQRTERAQRQRPDRQRPARAGMSSRVSPLQPREIRAQRPTAAEGRVVRDQVASSVSRGGARIQVIDNLVSSIDDTVTLLLNAVTKAKSIQDIQSDPEQMANIQQWSDDGARLRAIISDLKQAFETDDRRAFITLKEQATEIKRLYARGTSEGSTRDKRTRTRRTQRARRR